LRGTGGKVPPVTELRETERSPRRATPRFHKVGLGGNLDLQLEYSLGDLKSLEPGEHSRVGHQPGVCVRYQLKRFSPEFHCS